MNSGKLVGWPGPAANKSPGVWGKKKFLRGNKKSEKKKTTDGERERSLSNCRGKDNSESRVKKEKAKRHKRELEIADRNAKEKKPQRKKKIAATRMPGVTLGRGNQYTEEYSVKRKLRGRERRSGHELYLREKR